MYAQTFLTLAMRALSTQDGRCNSLIGDQGQDVLVVGTLHDSRLGERSGDMSDLYRLTDEQMAGLSLCIPKSHGKPRVDVRRVLSGMTFINRNAWRYRDSP